MINKIKFFLKKDIILYYDLKFLFGLGTLFIKIKVLVPVSEPVLLGSVPVHWWRILKFFHGECVVLMLKLSFIDIYL